MSAITAALLGTPGIAADSAKARASAQSDFQTVLAGAISQSSPDVSAEVVKLARTARQFEALMIGEVLKAAHSSGSSSWMADDEDDGSSETAMDMGQEFLAQALADGGGIGLAKMVTDDLARQGSKQPNSA